MRYAHTNFVMFKFYRKLTYRIIKKSTQLSTNLQNKRVKRGSASVECRQICAMARRNTGGGLECQRPTGGMRCSMVQRMTVCVRYEVSDTEGARPRARARARARARGAKHWRGCGLRTAALYSAH